jgi:hypothetical protein
VDLRQAPLAQACASFTTPQGKASKGRGYETSAAVTGVCTAALNMIGPQAGGWDTRKTNNTLAPVSATDTESSGTMLDGFTNTPCSGGQEKYVFPCSSDATQRTAAPRCTQR